MEESQLNLFLYDDISIWYQDNIYIRHGYCSVSNSIRVSFANWLYLYNETINIY